MNQHGNLLPEVKKIQSKSVAILQLAEKHGTPFYAIDEDALNEAAKNYRDAFEKHLPRGKHFYAVKSNYHPFILKKLAQEGFGMDVSSTRELSLALEAGAKEIIFTGPGKTGNDLEFALRRKADIIFQLDSFGELERLGKAAAKLKKTAKAGIRFFSKIHGKWSKFGIPLRDLKKFWLAAKKLPFIRLQGFQFHTSANLTPEKQITVIRELGQYLKIHFSKSMLSEIKFIDTGGGFYPDRIEGYYPSSKFYFWMKAKNKKKGYEIIKASSPEVFAREITKAFEKYIKPLASCEYFTEPGRIISAYSTHIVLRVVDVKNKIVITDGGINMVGWEFGRHFYLPIVNLTNPSLQEMKREIYGSLCTPRDFWGHTCFGSKIAVGDILVIPNQGAYRFTLAQNFIKPIPPSFIMTPQFSSVHERQRRAGAIPRRLFSSSPANRTKSPR